MTLEDTIDLYCTAWTDQSDQKRLEILNQCVTTDINYVDPMADVTGISNLSKHINNVIVEQPGAFVVRLSKVDSHHNLARFSWHMMLANGSALPTGLDVVHFNDEGKLDKILGFFGPLISLS